MQAKVINALREATRRKVGFDAEQNALAKRFNSTHKPGPTKRIESILNKLRRSDEYNWNPINLRDLVRSTQVFDNFVDFRDAFSTLQTEGRLVDFDNRFKRPQKSGYRDFIITYRTSDGHTAELQLHIPEMLFVKQNPVGHFNKNTHELYKLRADLKDANNMQGVRQVFEIEQIIHDEAWKYFKERTNATASHPLESTGLGKKNNQPMNSTELKRRIDYRLQSLFLPKSSE